MSDTLEDMLSRGAPAFLDALDVLTDPARLRALAFSWYAARDEAPRRLLLAYLARPLNPFHEPLVLRLFNRARRAGDDEVMGLFLLLFDRSLRRHALPDGRWVMRPSGMPRGKAIGDAYLLPTSKGTRVVWLSNRERRDYEAYRLFAVPTRLLFRRRAWHYFDQLGREHPERYVAALAPVLRLYTDDDVGHEPGFLGNWGLLQVLFHHSRLIRPHRRGAGWRNVHSPWLQWHEIPPAPAHETLWKQRPLALFDLAADAPCRLVNLWANQLMRGDSLAVQRLSVADLFGLLVHSRVETASAAAQELLDRGGLEEISVERWLSLLDFRGDGALPPILELCERYLPPERLTLEQAVSLACSYSLSAQRGWNTYVAHHLKDGAANPEVLLRLLDAPVESLRQEMVPDIRSCLAQCDEVQLHWLGAFLDSEHPDVRGEGLHWARTDSRLADEPAVWRRMLASARRDVCKEALQMMDDYQVGRPRVLRDALPLTLENVRALWARVLLTLHGGSRTKVLLARQLIARLEWRPEENVHLLPMLGEVLQHSGGPAWEEALAGVVRLVERHPEWEEIVMREAPSLVLAAQGPLSLP